MSFIQFQSNRTVLRSRHSFAPILTFCSNPIWRTVWRTNTHYWSYVRLCATIHLNLSFFFQHQNGSLVDALTLWKRNVDKRFEGVEECYICFFILHGSTYQMPKVGCPTCKKKFHSACLYKWFSTSQNSTCPLCRNLFWK